MMSIDVNKSRSSLLFFVWQRGLRLKYTVGPTPGPHMQLWMKVSLRKLVDVARGPLWRAPDWRQSIQSAQGRPCWCTSEVRKYKKRNHNNGHNDFLQKTVWDTHNVLSCV